jgi:UDP-N-acetyl-D-galactosamine dehydrogenase
VKIAVVGLGYVGLPLAVALARIHDVVGFDVSPIRVADLRKGLDSTNEVSVEVLRSVELKISGDPASLRDRDVFIVTVPTPIDEANRPDFDALLKACALVGPALSKGAIVVFESTVYPGVTEEVCAPALEQASGLKAGVDFKLGYSPERINPGDKTHPLEKVVKVVAGQDAETLDTLANLYGSVVEAGIHRAPSIKVAEAAKVIENTQRDLNIALINEVSLICHKLGIDTRDVLEAAGTKWNFLPFRPGLVGGHCIGVDPFYLTHKAMQLGYHPQVILAGRRVNDDMGSYVATETIRRLVRRGGWSGRPMVTILGATFKENVPDVRNTRCVDIVRELRAAQVEVQIVDPLASADDMRQHYGIELTPLERAKPADAVILAVAHKQFVAQGWTLIAHLLRDNAGVAIDVPAILPRELKPENIELWRL